MTKEKKAMRHRMIGILVLMMTALSVQAQEAEPDYVYTVQPDTTLHLPALNALGQMHYINSWPMNYCFGGWHDWELHQGLNMNLGASVLTSFSKYAPSGVGFAQNVTGMYAWPLNDKLSLAFGGYFVNADWGGFRQRDAGFNAVLGYRFNDRWEGYLYAQKSLMKQKPVWPFTEMNELGDRLGAAIRYNISPSAYIQVSIENTPDETLPEIFRPVRLK